MGGVGRSDLSSELLEPEPSVLREENQLSPHSSCLVTRLLRGKLKVNWAAAAKNSLRRTSNATGSWVGGLLRREPAGMKACGRSMVQFC